MYPLRENLLYQGVSSPFRVPLALEKGGSKNKIYSLNEVVDSIKGEIDYLRGFKTSILKRNIQHLLNKLNKVRTAFKETVDQTARNRETGRSVAWALQSSLEKLIPNELIGGKENKKQLIKNIKKTFLFGKDDSISKSHLIDNIRVERIVYIRQMTATSAKEKACVVIVKWLWTLVKRLVAWCFYVSEKQESSNQLVFIPKRVWQSETQKSFDALMESSLKLLSPTEAGKLVGFTTPGRMRWVPKREGLRPIMSSRKKVPLENDRRAKNLLNSLLKHCPPVNSKAMHSIWDHLLQLQNQGRKLYFIACDVLDAYGSVKHEKMIEILDEEVMSRLGPLRYKEEEDVICSIKNKIKFQIFCISKKTYLLTKGLPQGMRLSSTLCNLYLSNMHRHCLHSMYTREDRLLRTVDDYLFITPDRARAQLFLDTMSNGFEEYGIKIKPSKTQTNLDEDREILYCGFLVNTSNLEVYVRHRAGLTSSFRNCFVIKSDPILLLEEKIVHCQIIKIVGVILDTKYMSVEGITRNLFHTGCLLARLLTALLALARPSDIPEGGVVANLVEQSAITISNKVCRVWRGQQRARNEQPFKIMTRKEVLWAVLQAYLLVLSGTAERQHILPDDLLLVVSHLSETARQHVRPTIYNLMAPIVNNVPAQYRNYEDY